VRREQRKTVTVLFCDVTGSTALGESTDPEAVRALLARYFERMKAIVEAHGGSVEKFIGDAVMAVFGVPVAHEDDALRACRTAVAMRDAFSELGISGRIGVSTGEVVTGTEERLATGDAVNVAARLEQAAQPEEVLIGAETLHLVRPAAEVGDERSLRLKGKSEPVPAWPLLRVTGELERRFATPMVGRERELQGLHAAFARALEDGSCQLFTILGSAGVGKSRLAAEFLAVLGGRVVRGRCLSYGEGITYWPVVEVLRQLGSLPEGSAARPLRSLLGETSQVASAEEIAWGFRKLLEQEAQAQALVVVFDDLHWAEETLLDLVEYVAELSRDAGILLLCMARPELLERRPSWGGGKWNATTVLLEPLNAAETERLLADLGDVPEQLHERIVQVAEGNPLFLEEMLALVRDSGGGEVEVPPTIQALLAARLDQLAPAERSVLERGSVEGRTFHRGAVAALVDGDGSLDLHLVALVRKELVRPDRSQLPNDDAYRFRHLLIRDATYDAVPKATRAELHERFADWLERCGHSLVELEEILGYHLEQANRYRRELAPSDERAKALAQRAAGFLTIAGRRAFARGDAPAAVNLFRRAAALVSPEGREQTELLSDFGQALLAAGNLTQADTVLGEAISGAETAGDLGLAAKARVAQISLQLQIDPALDLDQIEREAQAAITRLERDEDELGLARAWLLMVVVWNFRCRAGEMLEAAERAHRHARACRAEREQAESLFWQAVGAVWGPLPVHEGQRLCEQILADSRGRPLVEAAGRIGLSLLEAEQGRFEEARTQIRASRAIYRELGLQMFHAGTSLPHGEIELLAGDWQAAEQVLREGYEVLEAMGETAYLSTIAARLAEVVYRLGRLEEAEHLTEISERTAAATDLASQQGWRSIRALVLAQRDQAEQGEALAREAVDLIRSSDFIDFRAPALLALADVLAHIGKPALAIASLEEALALYESKGHLVMAKRARSRLDELRAV